MPPEPTPTPTQPFVDPQGRFSILFFHTPTETSSKTVSGTPYDYFENGNQSVIVYTFVPGNVGEPEAQSRSDAAFDKGSIVSSVHGTQDGHDYVDVLIKVPNGYYSIGGEQYLYTEEWIIAIGRYEFIVSQFRDSHDPPAGFAAFAATIHFMV